MIESDSQHAKRVIGSVFGWCSYFSGFACLAFNIFLNIVEKFITQVATGVTSQFLWLGLVIYLITSGGGIALVTNANGPSYRPGKIGRWAFWIIGLFAVMLAAMPPN